MSQGRAFNDRERYIYLAKLAEQSERYDDMITYMKGIIDTALASPEPEKRELTVEERNLLSVAYKNVIGARRQSWRTISHVEGQLQDVQDEERVSAIKAFRTRVEGELEKTCADILEVLGQKLIPNAITVEGKVFYYKMCGDYHRYQTEFQTPPSQSSAGASSLSAASTASAESARAAYASALDHSSALSPTNPIRLGLALNFSVYYYEIVRNPSKACELAKTAFDEAMAELDTLSEESYKDSTLIMQLLRDNLGLWTQQSEEPARQERAEAEAPPAPAPAPEPAAEAQPEAA